MLREGTVVQTLVKRAEAAAAAHRVAARVSVVDEIAKNQNTGNVVVSVRIYQDIAYAPEGNAPKQIDAQRLIGISGRDAKRLFIRNSSEASGQDYHEPRRAKRVFSAVDATVSGAVEKLLNTACGDTFWRAAHDVADEAAELEVEMRFRLRADLEGDADLSFHNSGDF